MTSPRHHRPGGGFRAPWAQEGDRPRFSDFLRWRWERLTGSIPPDPDPEEIPREQPRVARPTTDPEEARVTWLGHATFLVQVGGVNLLTDPVLGMRVSPVPWMGPERLVPAPLAVEDLPPLDAVLLSHDHYDHLDRPTVVRLHRRFGSMLRWITPLGYRRWFRRLGVTSVTELDWWEGTTVTGSALQAEHELRVRALPAQHWTRRRLRENRRLWASYALSHDSLPSVYFGGDSGYFPGYAEIGEREGPFQLSLLPIGAYEPRWFMKFAHMNPEDAVRAYLDLGGTGGVVGMHWGTFRLTDEHPLEPPGRMRAAWKEAGLPPERLHLPGIGGTVHLSGGADSPASGDR